MDISAVRKNSEAILKGRGLPINANLPNLGNLLLHRDAREVQNRTLALQSVVALACGADPSRVKGHLEQEDLARHLSPSEVEFVSSGDVNLSSKFRVQEEGLLALAWSLGLAVELDPFRYCDESLGRALPSGKLGRTVEQFRSEASPRAPELIIALLDLLYRMDWAFVTHPQKAAKASGVQWYVVRERRRALEWLFLDEPWDEVTLDT